MTDLPSIPSIPAYVDPELSQVLNAIKQNIDYTQSNTPVTKDNLNTAISTAISTIPAGEQGLTGVAGDSYVLDITGGFTTIIYDENGSNPLHPSGAFGFLLYKNGIAITQGITFNWFISNPSSSLLSGTGTSSTFTPNVASAFDINKSDNTVNLSVVYNALTITAKEPVSITKIGTTGNAAAIFSINNSAVTFTKGINNVISPTTLALTTSVNNIIVSGYQWYKSTDGGSTYTAIASANASSYTITSATDYASVTTITYKCIVTGTINGVASQTLNDTITIPLLSDSKSAISVVLSNENISFPALVTGYTGVTFTGGNCNITVYIGTTQLTYDANAVVSSRLANTFSCTNSSTGATVAPGVGSGSTYAIAAPTAMSTDSAYTDVVITIRDASNTALASITKRITYSLSRAGNSYALFITGGITNAVYDTSGSNPLPAQTAFSCELYENGTLKTPASHSWSVPSTNTLLTGSSSVATFTPTLAAVYDRTKSDNRVLLTVTYAGVTVKAVQPIVATQLVLAAVDTTPPALISGLTVTAGILYNYLGWGTLPSNFDHAEVWRAASNNRAVAVLIGTSLFTVYADYIPSGVGTTYYYWIRAISKASVAGAWNATAGISASPKGITDSQVSTLSATKIVTSSLSALSGNLGGITAGVIAAPTGQMLIDLTTEKIEIASSSATGGTWNANHTSFTPGSYDGGNYITIDNGDITTRVWNGSKHETSKSLNTIESGTCASGAIVELKKYYINAPRVMVSPYKLQVYDNNYPTADQVLTLNPGVISLIAGSSGRYTFTPTATLSVASAISATQSPNTTVTNAANTAITSAQYQTAALTTAFNIVVSVNSIRGDGATSYYRRNVSIRIKYGTVSGTYPNATAAQIVDLGPDNTANTANLTFSGITAGTYYFVVEYTSSDVTPLTKFASGTPAYTYLTDQTVNATTDGALAAVAPATGSVSAVVANATFPAFTPAAGYSVYNVVYTFAFGYYLHTTLSTYACDAWITWPNSGYDNQEIGTYNVPSSTATTTTTSASYSTSPASGITIYATSDSTYTYTNGNGGILTGVYGNAQAKVFAAGTKAVISQRMANTNSTAIVNSFTLKSFYTNLSSTAVAIAGELNWIAIG